MTDCRFTQLIMRLSCLLLLFAISSCASGDGWRAVQQRGTLRVGLDPSYPPFENADSGQLVGIDVDLARALASELGVTAQFEMVPFDGLYDALLTGRVDVLLSALVIDTSKSADFAFSTPYFNAGQVLLTPAGSTIHTMDDLATRTVAVELGAMGHVEAIAWQRRVADLRIVTTTTAADAVASLLNDCRDSCQSADAALIDNITAQLALSPALAIADPAVTVEPFAAVVRKQDRQLHDQLNRALAQLEASGTLQEILADGFGR